jgi:outer membrane protein assembly factor BamB
MLLPLLLVVVLTASERCPAAQPGEAAAADEWPQWRGACRDGHVPALPRNMPPFRLLWKQPVAGPCDAGIAISAGRAVVPDHGDKQDVYRCLDARNGTGLWNRVFPNDRELDYGAGPRATPLIYQGKVYALGAFGDLYCFDLGTGKTVWQKDFGKDFGARQVPKWGCCGSPLVARGKLIINPGGKAAVAALDPETGNVLWEGEGSRANYSSFIAATFGGVEQVVGHDDSSLGGWELATGKRLWSIPMEQGAGFIVPTPVAVGGKLLVTDSNNETQLFAFGKDGVILESPLAKSEAVAPEVITPVAAGVLVLGQSKRLVCLDAADELKTLWTDATKVFKADCHLVVADGVGLGLNKQGEAALFSFDRKGVKILGQAKLCQRTLMHPTVALGRLYVRDAEFLYCYSLDDPARPGEATL